jgi:ectoine hydroxylase-related dioxygenase (phytanoyl-CoA dioxygenase family)
MFGTSPLAADANTDGPLPWFMFSDYTNDSRYMSLSHHDKHLADRFMKDGFLVFKNEIADAQTTETVALFNEFAARNADYFDPFRDEFGYLHRIVNLHLAFRPLLKLFAAAKNALAFQDALFGGPTSVYTSLYYERGSSQTIHRDTPYFTTRPEYNYFGMWFALEDATQRNGCLEVVRGGHLINEIDRADLAIKHFGSLDAVPAVATELFDDYQNIVIEQCKSKNLEKEKIELSRGDVLIWHPQLPHGGSVIKDRTKTRHSIVIHTVAARTPVYQANAFFNPQRLLPLQSYWEMDEFDGRQFAKHATVEVMHQGPRSPAQFR